jgi:hypothetical protein
MCWDSKTDGGFIFYLRLQSYPPIGALINMETNSKMFQIESLEIQSSRGAIAKAILDKNVRSLRAPAERKPLGLWLAPAVQHSSIRKVLTLNNAYASKTFHYISKEESDGS